MQPTNWALLFVTGVSLLTILLTTNGSGRPAQPSLSSVTQLLRLRTAANCTPVFPHSREAEGAGGAGMVRTQNPTTEEFLRTSWHGCANASREISNFAVRPKLMIWVGETTDRRGRKESLHVADNLSKYCARHGYVFRFHHYEVDPVLGPWSSRWKEVLKYWWVYCSRQRFGMTMQMY
jgi:hypothetical protein